MPISIEEIRKLSVLERIELISQIWDSIESPDDLPPLTEAQRGELDRRIEAYERDPTDVSTWDEVYARITRRE